jgi:hypothetical protein
MTESDDGAWFAPRRFGFGPGLPITWQGWLVSAGHILAVLVGVLIAERSLLAGLSIIVSASSFLLIVAARRTRGGLRWRGGRGSRRR